MRKPTLSLVALVTLLMGADSAELTTRDLPACAANTYLVYRQGRIVCAPTLPDCQGQLLYAGPGGDLAALGCTAKVDDALTADERQRIARLQALERQLSARLDALDIQPALAANFVGITAATTVGRIEHPGVPAGLPAANARCADEYGFGGHLCAAREMVGAVLNGNLDPNVDVPLAWLYMPTWNNTGGEQPLAGLGDNCGGYTDASTTRGWAGMAVSWSQSFTSVRILHFSGGPLAPCDKALPLACCR